LRLCERFDDMVPKFGNVFRDVEHAAARDKRERLQAEYVREIQKPGPNSSRHATEPRA
jgi:hypothetical protein